MSEEILKALVQLYAIIAKQGKISEEDRTYIYRSFKLRLSEDSVQEYMELFESTLGSEAHSETNVLDSVKTLSICKTINSTLTQRQKIIVLLELLEFIRHGKSYTNERKDIIVTVATVFNIPGKEFSLLEKFALEEDYSKLNYPEILFAGSHFESRNSRSKYYETSFELDTPLVFIYVPSVDTYFVKYEAPGNLELRLNHRVLHRKWLYLFSHGSIIKHPQGKNIFYSEIVSHFNQSKNITPIKFEVNHVEYAFSKDRKGLVDINIKEQQGKLVGIIGGSGSGKTTLLNVLSSLEKPSRGEVILNGIDIHKNAKFINGAIGYVPQFDILISELTVYENLHMTARLCMGELDEQSINEKIETLLSKLGLWHIKDLKVGSESDKKISGGQRKRLNIALELIREPLVIFLDEPTSGLSSKDSESIIQLLKDMTTDGKLIFSVVHQPSSEIFKMFDKIMILDQGGYMIYYGNPLESLIYYKSQTNQINSNQGYCHVCGSANPEQLFEIIETKIIDEFGHETDERKYSPLHWQKSFNKYREEHQETDTTEEKVAIIPKAITLPNKAKQFLLFTIRDVKQKMRDYQYLILNVLEAPVLAIILAYVLKYSNNDSGGYSYRYNENIPAYLFLGVIISLFMGLSGSAEEILKDKIIRRRERLLLLSRKSYLLSKILIQFSFSAVQTLTFVLIGNSILEVEGFFAPMWLMLFSTSCFANMLGLNISSMFKKAVTIYIAIPLLLIPQMILSGALFDFDKMNQNIRGEKNVPLLAEVIASRWAYEGLMVKRFRDNAYETNFYTYDREKNNASYVSNYLIPEIKKMLPHMNEPDKMKLIKQELKKLIAKYPEAPHNLNNADFSNLSSSEIVVFLDQMSKYAIKIYNHNDNIINEIHYRLGEEATLELKNRFFNERSEELVRNLTNINRVKSGSTGISRVIDPIYYLPIPENNLDFRAHFYAPKKFFMGKYYDTYTFNIVIIWLMTGLFYITLYFNFFKKLLYLNPLK